MVDSPIPTQTLMPLPQANYVQPGQLKAQTDYATALRQGNLQQPVHHWTQGVSNMFAALMGHNLATQNADQERQRNVITGYEQNVPYATPPDLNGQAPAPFKYTSASGDPQSFNEGPSSAGQTNAGEDKAIAGIESGGNYAAVGHPTKDGDRAYGKYQVMGKNIPEWSRAYLGKEMTPDEFLRDPVAQEAIFKNKFGEYEQKYGPEGAAKAWFAGEHGMNNPNARDVNGMTVSNYAQKFNQGMGAAPTGAMAYAGPDSGQNPAVQAISSALRNDGTQIAANAKRPPAYGQTPEPSGEQPPVINPALAPRVPPISAERMGDILANPYIPDAQKMMYQQMYLQQGQAVGVPYAGGRVLVDPLHPGTQQFVPDLQTGTTKFPGGYERPYQGVVRPGPNGTITTTPAQQAPVAPVGPQSGVAPAAPTSGPAPAVAPGPATAQAAPAAPVAPTQAPVQVASLDPTAGVAGGTAKPVSSESQIAQNAPVAISPMGQAIRTPPPGVSPEDWATIQGFKQNELDTKAKEADIDVNKTSRTQNNALAAKRYDNMQGATQAAYSQLDNLKTAYHQLQDPNFYSGLFSNEVEGLKKLGALFGGDPNSARPMEVFRKTMAQSIANGLKVAYGGLGQIRNKEIELSEKSNGSLNNTLPANLALVEIARRSAQRIANLGEMGTDYRLGHEVVDPIADKDGNHKVLVPANVGADGQITPRVGLDPGYDKAANQFVKDHPMFSDEEYKTWDKLFDQKPGTPDTASTAQPGAGGQPKVGEEKQFKQGVGVWDGKEWKPKGQ